MVGESFSKKDAVFLFVILFLAAYVRSKYFIGHGLGDDPIYSYTAWNMIRSGSVAIPLTYGGNYRVGILGPLYLIFKYVGINDYTFSFFPFMASMGEVLLVFFLARRVFGGIAPYLAALIQAFSAFDVTFASTMTIDIPFSFFIASSIYFFISADEQMGLKRLIYNVVAAFSLMWAYYVKINALGAIPVFAVISLIRWKRMKSHVLFALILGVFILTSFAFDFYVTGDPLNRLHVVKKAVPKPFFFYQVWNQYIVWMLNPSPEYHNLFFGYHFWLLVPAALATLFFKSLRQSAGLFLAWFAFIFLIMEFMPQNISPYQVPTRFFRHTYVFVVPATLVSACFLSKLITSLYDIRARGKWLHLRNVALSLVLLALVVFLADGVHRGWSLGHFYKSHYDDVKISSDLILGLENKSVISDGKFRAEYIFRSGYTRLFMAPYNYKNFHIQYNIAQGNNIQHLYDAENVYVVLGGSRGVDYGMYWVLESGGKEIPSNWKLIREYRFPPDAHRHEYLRVYDVP